MRFGRAARLLVLSAALVLVVPAGAAVASAPPADPRVPLIHQPLNNCELGADALPGGTVSRGFVVVHTLPQDRIAAGVVLRDARPNTTFNVFLIQSAGVVTGDPLDCHVQDGTITTDARGAGVLGLVERRLPTARFAHVYLFTQTPSFDHYDTRLIPVA